MERNIEKNTKKFFVINLIFFKKALDIFEFCSIILMLRKQPICESGGTGRRARLRGVWLHRTGSSPVSRTKKSTSNEVLFLFSIVFFLSVR